MQILASISEMSCVMRKPTFWFPIWSDINQAVQPQKMARGLKFRIKKEEGSHYLCSENKGADQLRGVTAKLICVFDFAYAKCWFSHDAAQFQDSSQSQKLSRLFGVFAGPMSRIMRKSVFGVTDQV